MRLSISRSPNATSLYAIKSVMVQGKRTTKVVEKLGTVEEIQKKIGDKDPIAWAKAYIQQLNEQEDKRKVVVIAHFSSARQIAKDKQVRFNGGYLFLQSLYHKLGLDQVCSEIRERYQFTFNLNDILQKLLYTRILYPSSKKSSLEAADGFLEKPDFELQHLYRSLPILAAEAEFIQSAVYESSSRQMHRNTKILYYDCTNFFFEIEREDVFREYDVCKQHRPNPLVQMGLFLDGSGLPLAFSIHNGSASEQKSLQPLERQIIRDFKLAQFIVCTDAGLGSKENRRFNTGGKRSFIVTQSLKTMVQHLQDWALDPGGWQLAGSTKRYNLDDSAFDHSPNNKHVYYKSRWEIEAAFRILKSEFHARPVYVRRRDCIQAHFMTCFLALLLYRMLELRIRPLLRGEAISGQTIVKTLREMDFHEIKGDGYIPIYTRNEITDALHDAFALRTDTEIVTHKAMNKMIRFTRAGH